MVKKMKKGTVVTKEWEKKKKWAWNVLSQIHIVLQCVEELAYSSIVKVIRLKIQREENEK